MSEFDSKALSLARQVMVMTRQTHIGGDTQLLAKIQCLFVEAMEYAAPQSNSPVIPDGWKLVPIEPTAQMIWAAKYVMTSTVGWDSFKEAYVAMLAAAPGKEG